MVLDSTVLIDALRGHTGALAYFRSLREPPHASEVTRAEVLRGLRSAERVPAERMFRLIEWRHVDESIAHIAGDLGRRFRGSHALGVSDLVVAATAQDLGLRVATSNTKHFPMFRGLKPPY